MPFGSFASTFSPTPSWGSKRRQAQQEYEDMLDWAKGGSDVR